MVSRRKLGGGPLKVHASHRQARAQGKAGRESRPLAARCMHIGRWWEIVWEIGGASALGGPLHAHREVVGDRMGDWRSLGPWRSVAGGVDARGWTQDGEYISECSRAGVGSPLSSLLAPRQGRELARWSRSLDGMDTVICHIFSIQLSGYRGTPGTSARTVIIQCEHILYRSRSRYCTVDTAWWLHLVVILYGAQTLGKNGTCRAAMSRHLPACARY